jgi:predicted Rossmann fold flavoprotein
LRTGAFCGMLISGEKMNEKVIYDIVIIGAGASGLMACIAAKSQNPACSVLVLEKNSLPAKKIYATGNGRCNYLNRTAVAGDYFSERETVFSSKLIDSVLSLMPPSCLEAEFQRMGIVGAAEEDGRLYPRSMQAKSVAEALCQELLARNAVLRCSSNVKACFKENNIFRVACQNGEEYQGRSVILTTGGKSGCQYGSEGEGYALAKSLGHPIVKPIPGLTQLLTAESTEELFGTRARAGLFLWKEKGGIRQLAARDEGEVQFTKEGISGICTFNISRFFQMEEGCRYQVELDLFTEYTEYELLKLFLERQLSLAQRMGGFILYGLVPDKLGDALLRRAGIDRGTTVKDIHSKALEKLAKTAKAFSFAVTGTKSWKDSQVTVGGVDLCEIKPETLESKLVEGLYFAGEIMDVDGPCGGYNLGWAFASGYVAGRCAAVKTS